MATMYLAVFISAFFHLPLSRGFAFVMGSYGQSLHDGFSGPLRPQGQYSDSALAEFFPEAQGLFDGILIVGIDHVLELFFGELAILDFDPHLGIRNLFDANDGIYHSHHQGLQLSQDLVVGEMTQGDCPRGAGRRAGPTTFA
jgi:hypothetical protein